LAGGEAPVALKAPHPPARHHLRLVAEDADQPGAVPGGRQIEPALPDRFDQGILQEIVGVFGAPMAAGEALQFGKVDAAQRQETARSLGRLSLARSAGT
jgi:hypothetical protein